MFASRENLQKIWHRSALWLSVLAPFFLLSYGTANWLAAQQQDVASIVYAWEVHIPFLAWTIIPYWSIDLLYGLSLFICASREEIDTLGKRLLTAQVIAVLCFIAFPLAFSFDRPHTTGLIGGLFTLLEGFDRPFNQAPSLHIALLVILWTHYTKHTPRRFHILLHSWFALIGLSVLTTYQHHFIDIPTGALLGLFCLWLWPEDGRSPLAELWLKRRACHRRHAAVYLGASGLLAVIASEFGGMALWMLWPAISLLLVAVSYGALGETVFQKDSRGQMSVAARLLLAPYILGAWFNSRLWTRNQIHPVQIADKVWLGRFPSPIDVKKRGFDCVVDLTAEMPAPVAIANWRCFPCLDLTTPPANHLREAADAIERTERSGKVLVSCALGYSRSAAAVATWLLTTRRAPNMQKAMEILKSAQPHIVLRPRHIEAIEEAVRLERA